jgi:hypothetical protein
MLCFLLITELRILRAPGEKKRKSVGDIDDANKTFKKRVMSNDTTHLIVIDSPSKSEEENIEDDEEVTILFTKLSDKNKSPQLPYLRPRSRQKIQNISLITN